MPVKKESLLMDKATTKAVINTICFILNIGTKHIGSDGLFRSDEVVHRLSKEIIESEIVNHIEWTASEAYEYFLLPAISDNSTKHWTVSSIYRTIAESYLSEATRRNYFELWFKHMMLAKLEGVKYAEGVTRFYAKVLTRESCCNLCKAFGNEEIYGFNDLLSTLPSIVSKCTHENSCYATISTMNDIGYNARIRRRKNTER
jgi:hypothetical protein